MTKDASFLVAAVIAAYNEKRWQDIPALLSPEVVCRIGPNAETVGPKGLLEVIAYYERYFDVDFEILKFFTDRDSVAFRAQLNATYHTTEPGMPDAVGQAIQVPLAGFADVVKGQVTRMSLIYNYEDWLRATDTHGKQGDRLA